LQPPVIAAHMVRLSRRQGLQLILGAARVVLLPASCCQARPSSAPDDRSVPPRSDRPPINRGVGGYASFPFVIVHNPPANHAEVTNRPTFIGANPLSAAVTDPMSGLQIVRLGGDPGAGVIRYDSSGYPVSTGLVFPNCLRNPNTPTAFKSINADGTIVAITEFIDVGTQPEGTLCRAYLVDVTGQYTGGVPWRIMRASSSNFFGEHSSPFSFWDRANPFRMFVKNNDGRIDAWYPIGTSGENPNGPGFLETWVPAPSGYDSFVSPSNGRDHDNVTTRDARWHMAGCRCATDGLWGGIRVDLVNRQYVNPFVPSPAGLQDTNRPTMRQGDSLDAAFCMVQTPGSGGAAYSGVTVATATIHNSTPIGFSHPAMVDVNGIPYIIGVQGNSVYTASWRLPTGPARTIAHVPQSNPTHATPLLGDRFEDNGGTGSGATTGDRYVVQIINNNSAGQRSMFAVRLGPNDTGVVRFLCDPRVNRTANYNECHAQGGWFGDRGFVVFASNWAALGNNSTSQVSPYAVLLPSGWASPNNSGS
jgi:hypothetical protein